jgi:hypothetical protein
MILVRTGDLFGRLRQDESAAACYVAAAAQSKKLSSAEEAREIREEILHAARGLKVRATFLVSSWLCLKSATFQRRQFSSFRVLTGQKEFETFGS